MPNRKYYILAIRNPTGIWSVEFGDYEKEAVKFELQTFKDSGLFKSKDLKIITTGETQDEINLAIAELNN